MTFRLSKLKSRRTQPPQAKQTLFPLLFDYTEKESAKPVEVRILAGSKRLWVAWLSAFEAATQHT